MKWKLKNNCDIPTIMQLLIIVLSILTINNNNLVCCEDDEVGTMSFIGDAIEGFRPCDESYLTMERIIGGPPNLENYWDGTFSLDKWPRLTEVRISLTVDNPAKFVIDSNVGRVLVRDRTFHISTFNHPPAIRSVKFKIQGPAQGEFPNVNGVTLNGLNVCHNPRKWTPAILGLSNNASTPDFSVASTAGGSTYPSSSGSTTSVKCGKQLVQHNGLVTKGFATDEGEYPWHAAVYHVSNQQQTYKCGGSLINTNTIITAAHCVYENGRKLVPDRFLIQLGKHDLRISGVNTQEFQVFKVIAHDEYSIEDLRNDIAILKLATEVTLTNYVQPICLWNEENINLNEIINKNGHVVGWGFTEFDVQSQLLRQARMPVVSLTTCLNSNRNFFGLFLSDRNYCAGFHNGTSVCNGDSGGGMYFVENGIYRLRGIVSLTISRKDKQICDSREYVIFTDVAKYLNWIQINLDQQPRSYDMDIRINN